MNPIGNKIITNVVELGNVEVLVPPKKMFPIKKHEDNDNGTSAI